MMKKIIAALLTALSLTAAVHANEGGPAWDQFPKERLTDLAALRMASGLRPTPLPPSARAYLHVYKQALADSVAP